MTGPYYSFRANAFKPERTFRIGADALYWQVGNRENGILYRSVSEIRYYRRLARGDAVVLARTTMSLQLRCHSGQHVTLSPLHYNRFRHWEDRSALYSAFVDALLPRLRENPDLKIATEVHWTLRLRRAVTRSVRSLLGRFGEKVLNLFRPFGLDRTARFGARLMRTIGPCLTAHRVARANLKAAFPEKSNHEIDRLLRGVWDNFGRVMAEYAFTDELYDYNPLDQVQKRIILDQATVQRVFALRNNGQPVLFFSAHLGSWELASLATAFGIPLTAVYRPFKSAALNELVTKRRGRINLVHARFGALAQIESCLQQGSSVGMLVDQHFSGGTDVVFFGRKCKANPTLATLARKYGCPIYGVRAIRLPGSRFYCEVTQELKPPRDDEGKLDIASTTQMIAGVVEAWVREHPEQWLWLHRRWRQ
jgi:KDO2-lipid IV(A) lauroyltransferase